MYSVYLELWVVCAASAPMCLLLSRVRACERKRMTRPDQSENCFFFATVA